MDLNYPKLMIHWFVRGLFSVVGGTCFITPVIAAPQLSSHSSMSEILLVAEVASATTLTGQLDSISPTLSDGSYYQAYTFEGTAGEEIVIELNSDDFDAYLILVAPDGELIAQDDNGGISGTDSAIMTMLPVTGVYTVIASTYDEAAVGSYSLESRAVTETDRALAEVAQLEQRVAQLYQSRQYAEAVPLAERILAVREEALGEFHPRVAVALNTLALLAKVQGNYNESELLLQRALSIYEQELGRRHPWLADSLNNLAEVYRDLGKYVEAEPLFQRSLSIRENALGESHPNVATSLNNLAEAYRELGKYVEAEPLFQRSLSIWENALGESHPNVATSLNNLALLYRTQGRYVEAESLFQRSLLIREQALDESHPDIADSLSNLASLYQDQGDYAEAELLFRRSLSIREQTPDENHLDIANSLNNLGLLHQIRGNSVDAELLYRRALSILEQVLNRRHPLLATVLNNLALLHTDQGAYDEAELLFERSLLFWEETLGERHPDTALSLNNLAELHREQGNYAEAELLLERSLSILKEVLGERHPAVAISLSSLALLHYDQSSYAEAESLYERTLSIRRESLGESHPSVGVIFNNLASLSWVKGDFNNSLRQLKQSVKIEEENINLNIVSGSESSKRYFINMFSGTTDSAISLHLQELKNSSDASELAFSTVLQRKGRLLDLFTNGQQTLRTQLDPNSQALLSNLESKKSQLSVLFYNQPESIAFEEYRSQVAILESQIQDLEDQLSRRSSEFRALNQPADVPTIQALLPAEDSTLVELVRYRPFNPAASNNNRYREARYAAYLLKSDGSVEGVDLGAVTEIDPLIADLQRAIRNPSFTVHEVKATARTLDAVVMAPIREHIGDTKHLLLSPDGALNLVPFEALVDEEGDYLVENYTLTYLTSGRDLLRMQSDAEAQSEPLLIANPNFELPGNPGVSTRYGSPQARKWIVLEGSGQEADAIAANFSGARNLQGAEATEAALKQANRPRFLHIATHGFFESRNSAEEVLTDNPLLRSGLVLSGVNVGESGAQEDGIVSALEVSSLNLVGTQLAVLSACETGLGDLSVGEGVYGLRRALVLAGSESQLISLWRVEDESTRDLMVEYYDYLLSGAGRSEALRKTQLSMLSDEATAHPYYWAAFINSGDWRPLTEE